MLKIALVLALAVAALADSSTYTGFTPQVVRLGSVGSTYSYLNGVLVPYTKHAVAGIPAYELRQLVKGVPHAEEEHFNFRCSHIEDALVPAEAVDRPMYLCRNLHMEKESFFKDGKMTFLFHASELKTMPVAKEIDLWVGKSVVHDLINGALTRVLDYSAGNVIRFGSIGTRFAHFNSYVVPHTKMVTEGIPSYEVRAIVDGNAKEEAGADLFNFRCGFLENFHVPVETDTKSVYMCRHISHDSAVPSDRKVFLFSADALNIAPATKSIDLWFGKSLWTNFVSDVYAVPTFFRDTVPEHIIRVGSIGTKFAGLKGVLVPYTKVVSEGIPSFELRSVVKGVPLEEHDLAHFRCQHLEDFNIPLDASAKPVFMCRGVGLKSDSAVVDKTVFLFSAENFPPTTKIFDLWLGKTLWHDFTSDVYTTGF
ncbi:uncharacterized protein LOC124153168 [Ischnura elegans]|uniref:uncharacterized protein LOC124153168 n=1 Tax=Ischnura elegans TaxID=197161 RepID=UPI001ED884FD|nr:uncharacterized protein LOC124153168 [Ischnura elegans]